MKLRDAIRHFPVGSTVYPQVDGAREALVVGYALHEDEWSSEATIYRYGSELDKVDQNEDVEIVCWWAREDGSGENEKFPPEGLTVGDEAVSYDVSPEVTSLAADDDDDESLPFGLSDDDDEQDDDDVSP